MLSRRVLKLFLALSVPALMTVLPGRASADVITWDFTTASQGGSYGGGSFGNSRTYSAGGVTVTVTAWGYTYGSDDDALEEGALGKWGTGLGACNQSEGSNCPSPQHQVDNVGLDDWTLFLFDTVIDVTTVRVDPYGTWDRDATYWVGNIDPASGDLTGVTYADLTGLGFGPRFDDYSSASSSSRNVSIQGGFGNALLFGTLLGEPSSSQYKDRFKIKALTATAVAEPSSLMLLATGFGMVWYRRACSVRRRRRSAGQV